MRLFIVLLISITGANLMAQMPDEPADPRYFEDQFYLGLNYNLLQDKPSAVSQNNLSYGIHLGFIKDLPLNSNRTFAAGLGLGYGVNSYYSNLRAIRNGSSFQYLFLDNTTSYRRNKLETHLIELPVQLRWRNSTASEFKFWRIYAGMKFGYIVGSRSKFVTSDFIDSFYNTDTENFQYGLTLDVGYNTFNLHVYYGLNGLFEAGVVGPDGQSLQLTPLRIGLIFYIL
ncbi:porin family protein [Robiginitalea sp. IMCC43444]|uniref:porin family protein n=1 Tax=Robiginitalea sp. IMCC43444 TaxID=3459121 RepID=UPI004041F404